MSDKRKYVERMYDVNTDKLYGGLETAIQYLKEVKKTRPNVSLHENWTGYEDMEIVFYERTLETDKEFSDRIAHEKFLAEIRAEEEASKKLRQAKLDQLNSLKRELGL